MRVINTAVLVAGFASIAPALALDASGLQPLQLNLSDIANDRSNVPIQALFLQVQNHINRMLTARGLSNGFASLDGNGLLPLAQLSPVNLMFSKGGSIRSLIIPGSGIGSDFNVLSRSGYWLRNTPTASAVANFVRLNDRLIIGKDAQSWSGAYDEAGTDFAWKMGRGNYSYLPRNTMMWVANPYGTIGGLFSSRTEDSSKLPGVTKSNCCAIAVASVVLNDNATISQNAWNYYATGVKTAGAGNVHNAEFDVLNATNTVVRIGPYKQDSGGITLGLSLNAGGEGAPYNNPSNRPYPQTTSSSAAMQILSNGTTFDKGIVIKTASISPTADGSTVGLDMPANYLVRWPFDASDATGGYITSSVSSTATELGLELSDFGALFKNRLGTIYGQINLVRNAVNRPVLSASVAGEPVQIAAIGSDSNIDLQLAPKGTGRAIAPNVTATATMTPPAYTAATLPSNAPTGSIAYCSDCREPGQAQGAGTGILAFKNASEWRSSAGGLVLN